MDSITVAAVSWEVRMASSLNEYLDHATLLVEEAVSRGAALVVLPESIDLERMAYHGFVPAPEVPGVLVPDYPKVQEHFQQLADHHIVTIVAGAHLREVNGVVINSVLICWPGGFTHQDKNILTQWEVAEWCISDGRGLRVTPHMPLGALVCYDSEFPPACQTLCEAGAQIIAIPAYNEYERGFNRVRRSAFARAIENQVFVIHSALVGSLGYEPVKQTYGSSAIICPHVSPFPETGVLAETPLNQEAIVVAELELNLIEFARNNDDVRNWHDRHKGDWRILPN